MKKKRKYKIKVPERKVVFNGHASLDNLDNNSRLVFCHTLLKILISQRMK